MFAPRHRQSIDHTLESDAWFGNTLKFGVEEHHVE